MAENDKKKPSERKEKSYVINNQRVVIYFNKDIDKSDFVVLYEF